MLNLEYLNNIQEVQEKLVSASEIENLILKRAVILFKAKRVPIAIGRNMLVKVNTNIGISSAKQIDKELKKLHAIATLGFAPDSMMDHTIARLKKKQFYKYILEEFDGPVGTLPHYLAFHSKKGIDEKEFLDIANQQAEAGVSFMTLHPTSTRELYEKAGRVRNVPTTSRGGGIVIRDMYLNDKKVNVIEKSFPDLLKILSKYNMGISIGSTFRPAHIGEALDEVHREEIALQGKYIEAAQEAGVPVQIEGIGHIRLNQLVEYYKLIENYQVPMMPLGPLPTDAATGQDHITNAIGATIAAWIGGAHIINSITREEHTGGVPTEDSIIEGLKAARIAAHSVNIARFPELAWIDKDVADLRSNNFTCVVEGGLFSRSAIMQYALGCTRCGPECPLLISKQTLHNSK
jgi:phosphomethylpyrimidine synthase